jgi:hypothetical protein
MRMAYYPIKNLLHPNKVYKNCSRSLKEYTEKDYIAIFMDDIFIYSDTEKEDKLYFIVVKDTL